MSDKVSERRGHVQACVQEIRGCIEAGGLSRDTLEQVKGRLIALARRPGMFTVEDFPPPPNGDRIYLMSEQDDHSYALYVVSGSKGKLTPPHDHTTWAVIVGIEGEEHNRIYERTDDGSVAGKAELKLAREFTVAPGNGLALMPEDIHSIAMEQEGPSLFIHMYGLSLDHLPGRVSYDLEAGTYQHYPAHPDVDRQYAA